MPRKSYAKSSKRFSRTKRTYKRYNRFHRTGYRTLAKRISAVSKRVAGEVCKFEITPNSFTNSTVTVGTGIVNNHPLNTITSGTPWVMPLNWFYEQISGVATSNVYYNGNRTAAPAGTIVDLSFKNPLWYNTSLTNTDSESMIGTNIQGQNFETPGLQYRLKYIYINALFNASVSQSINNTDGALRIVVIKDKQASGGSATWYDEGGENSRGVFNANRIDAQLNPNTVGRFKIMYDKTLRFNTTNGYKPFKYYKRLSSVVRNNRDFIPSDRGSQASQYPTNINSLYNALVQTSDKAPPVEKNAFYLMIFSDGLTFNYSQEATTPAASFHLFNRVAYFNN